MTSTDADTPDMVTEKEHLRTLLGIPKPLADSKKVHKPTLVYFHWPHEHAKHGELTTTLCSRTLDNEDAARLGLLFRCVQVDMGTSEAKLAEAIGCTGKPGFVLLDEHIEVVATIKPDKSSSKLIKGIEKAFKKCKAYYKSIQGRIKQQQKDFKKAKLLAKMKDYDAALRLVDSIRFGDLRTTKLFDEAQSYGQLLAQKRERERTK